MRSISAGLLDGAHRRDGIRHRGDQLHVRRRGRELAPRRVADHRCLDRDTRHAAGPLPPLMGRRLASSDRPAPGQVVVDVLDAGAGTLLGRLDAVSGVGEDDRLVGRHQELAGDPGDPVFARLAGGSPVR